MNDTETILPLKDVWLRPRRVFRELASRPIGSADLMLVAAQGIADYVAVLKLHTAEPRPAPSELLAGALVFGSLVGLLRAAFFAFLYNRIAKRLGGTGSYSQVFHVLSYGSVPQVTSLLLWALTALLVGEAALFDTPPAGTDGFVMVLLRAQSIAAYLLFLWSYLLQVMGLSEVFDFKLAKAFGLWILGQVIAAVLSLLIINLQSLFGATGS